MILKQIISKVSIKKFLKMQYPNLMQLLVLIEHLPLTIENCFIVGLFSKTFFSGKLNIFGYIYTWLNFYFQEIFFEPSIKL